MNMGWLIWFVAIKIESGKTQFSKQLALINIYNDADDLQVLSGTETPVSVHLLVRQTDFVFSL